MTMASRITVMDHGDPAFAARDYAQQAGQPFVARFSAHRPRTPCRRLQRTAITGAIVGAASRTAMRRCRRKAPCPAYIGREVVLGIRPECISDGGKRAADIPATRIEAEVEVSEPTGAETIVLIRIAGERLRARVAPDIKLPPGRPASFSVDTRTICLFDPQTERLIA
jgi:multiple sugar transport system ATP-binding protein